MCNKQLCMRLLYFVVIRLLGNSRWLWAEVAHFKLACIGNLAFKGDQSRNVIWQWSDGTHLNINRGSYMSAHVLLNLLNELGKRDKMRGLPSILSLFRNEFNKFNNTRARMLDSIYHMIKSHFCRKTL